LPRRFSVPFCPLSRANVFPAWRSSRFYEAALAEAQVGGDFYDALPLGDGRAAFVVGDVSGKGLEAAAYTAEIKIVLRAFLRETGDPGAALERLNAHVIQSQQQNEWAENSFVAICVVIVDTERERFTSLPGERSHRSSCSERPPQTP
jgi:sigma-B regulation protein RsbU (phosphoserine phosphatase)